jgi:hypothetical protein
MKATSSAAIASARPTIQSDNPEGGHYGQGAEHVVRKMFRIRRERLAAEAGCGFTKRAGAQKIHDN